MDLLNSVIKLESVKAINEMNGKYLCGKAIKVK